jgi:hypothetical protein
MKGERQIEAELSNLSSEVRLSVHCSLLIKPYAVSPSYIHCRFFLLPITYSKLMDRLSCSNNAFHVVISYGTGSVYVHFGLGRLRVYVFFSKVV